MHTITHTYHNDRFRVSFERGNQVTIFDTQTERANTVGACVLKDYSESTLYRLANGPVLHACDLAKQGLEVDVEGDVRPLPASMVLRASPAPYTHGDKFERSMEIMLTEPDQRIVDTHDYDEDVRLHLLADDGNPHV